MFDSEIHLVKNLYTAIICTIEGKKRIQKRLSSILVLALEIPDSIDISKVAIGLTICRKVLWDAEWLNMSMNMDGSCDILKEK